MRLEYLRILGSHDHVLGLNISEYFQFHAVHTYKYVHWECRDTIVQLCLIYTYL